MVIGVAAATYAGFGSSPAVHAQAVEPIELFFGCNNVTLTWQNGTPTTMVAAAVTPPDAITAVWRYDARETRFIGFAPQFPQASDLTSVNRLDAVFVCMSEEGTLNRPSLG